MTSSESQRAEQQRRIADQFMQIENMKANSRYQAIGSYVAAFTLAGVVIVAISVAQAEKVVKPTSDKVISHTERLNNHDKALAASQAEMAAIRGELKAVSKSAQNIQLGQSETNGLLRQLLKEK